MPRESAGQAQGQSMVPPLEQLPTNGAAKEVADQEVVKGNANVKLDGSDRPSKWARKKEKMTCYRCGENGHFVSECTAELCEFCLKPVHGSLQCPLTVGQMPTVAIYGACCQELMFFESTSVTTAVHAPDVALTGMVTVASGTMTADQVVQQLRDLVSASFRWDPIAVADNVFKVVFPSKEDLARLLKFGMCRVPSTSCILEFDS